MQRDSSPPDLPGYVPAGLYVVPAPARETASYPVTVNRTVPVGTTELVRRLLKGAPMRSFLLGELAQSLCIVGPLWELNACLCKLVNRGQVVKDERRQGSRVLKTYRWRLPSDG